MNRRNLFAVSSVSLAVPVLAAPAVARERVTIVLVSTWPRDFPGAGRGVQRLTRRISEMSDGRIHVEYYAAGEKVGAFDAFDEVASGNSDAYHAAEYYWKGKHPGWAYFTSVPFGLTCNEINAWIRFGGGQELWDELGARFGVKGVMCGNTGVQMGGWFSREINSVNDFKGLRMRIPGLGGDVFATLGVSPVSLPGAQIYENLASGTIDAAEWGGPWNDEAMKFYEAAKYYYYPGLQEPGSMLACGFNASFWGSLSTSDRMLLEAAMAMENQVLTAEYNARNSAALVRLVEEQGVELREFDEDVIDAVGRGAMEVFSTVIEHSDLARRIHESFARARSEIGGWTSISDAAYVGQRARVLGV